MINMSEKTEINSKKMNPMVSIVIPVYNGSNYLAEAIDSALGQTYRNKEIIVVNDGSTDGGKTEEIALAYGEKIRYFRKENGGSSSALNYGIRMMKGEYFSWLSHDDLYYPEKLEKEVRYIEENGLDQMTVLFSGADLIDSEGRIIRKANNLFEVSQYVKDHGNEYFIAQPSRYYFSGCTCLVHKKVFEEVGLFDEKLRLVNDYDLWFRVYSSSCKIAFVPETLVMSRMHAAQISRSTVYKHDTEEEKQFWDNTFEWLKEHHPKSPDLFIELGKCAYRQTLNKTGDKAFSYVKVLDPSLSLKLVLLKYLTIGKSKIWMLMKDIYLKLWVDRK